MFKGVYLKDSFSETFASKFRILSFYVKSYCINEPNLETMTQEHLDLTFCQQQGNRIHIYIATFSSQRSSHNVLEILTGGKSRMSGFIIENNFRLASMKQSWSFH